MLALGLAAAGILYSRASNPAGGGSDYRVVGDQVFEVDDSPGQLAQTRRMGGQSLVMIGQFDRWFASLWHGRRLAYTVAALAALTALLCLYVSGLLHDDAID